ncbi:MAG: hypothetical protein IEMM0002_1144 [bacterium]|nr:MAG: hypothetical protein IEMM0002_1144 [bacterium]
MDKNIIKTLMCEVPHFDMLDKNELEIMADHIDYMKVDKGNTLVKEGSVGDSLFYVIRGLIEIQKEALDGRQTVLARFSKGATVGEMAIVEKAVTRSATATSLERSELLVLTRKSFDELAKSHPTVALKIVQNIAGMLSQRLRYTSGRFADVFQ